MNVLLTVLAMVGIMYALAAGVTLLIGLADYSGTRGKWGDESDKPRALRTIRRCLIWPTLWSPKPLGRFLEDLWRDLRGGR